VVNPARGGLFIDRWPVIHPILFVFQQHGGEQLKSHAQKTAAAPLKNKKENIIRAFFL
jgi:hypothetical protein